MLLERLMQVNEEAKSAICQYSQTIEQSALLKRLLKRAVSSVTHCEYLGFGSLAMRLPILVYAGIRGWEDDNAIHLAAALLLLETGIYTLDHVMDGEFEPSPHQLSPSAVVLGATCLLSYLPQCVLMSLHIEPSLTLELLNMLNDGLAKISSGQLSDISSEGCARLEPQQVELVVAMKTGERRGLYAAMAARLARGDAPQVAGYSSFASSLGIARQLRSDLVDLFGTTPSRDLASGVRTLPLAVYLAKCDEQEGQDMLSLLQVPGHNPGRQSQVRTKLREAGVLREVIRRIEVHCQSALLHLRRVHPHGDVAELLAAEVKSISVSYA